MQKLILLGFFLIPTIIEANQRKTIEVEVNVKVKTEEVSETRGMKSKPKIPKTAKAEGVTQKTVNLKSDWKTVTNWFDQNQKLMRKTMNLKVLEEFGDGKFKVQKVTPKGTFVWIMKESIEISENKYVYKSSLIESVEGGMAFSDTVIMISPGKKGTDVNIKISAGVNNPEISTFDVKFDLNIHVGKLKNLLEENLN